MKIYGSKREIYHAGYAIASKFVPEFPVRYKENYEELFKTIERDYGWVINQFSTQVENIDRGAAKSFGFFLEVPAYGATGREMNAVRYVLLSHETGLEVFIPLILIQA